LKKAEILAGNIGYLDIHVFAPVSLAGDRMAAAMNFLSDCSALIFDLRQCGGGDPFTVQLLESYLFGVEPKLLITLQDRYENKNQQLWTLPHIPGKRMPDIPVYILTSAQTFSGGEDFSYTMKHHSRATIIGENTKGGAHTIQFLSVGEGFVLVLPTGQPIHPISGGNWEGTGVSPNIAVSFEEALKTAHMHALENLIKNCDNQIKANHYRAIKRRTKRLYEPLALDEADLKPLIGNYGHYQAIFEEGKLNIVETGNQNGWEAIPLSKTRFITDDEYDIEFKLDENGEVTGFKWLEIATGKEMLAAKTD
jgi:C-terminal processing protease CtpA/Prc